MSDFLHSELHVARAHAGLTAFLSLPIQELEPAHPLRPDIRSAQLLDIMTKVFQPERKENIFNRGSSPGRAHVQ